MQLATSANIVFDRPDGSRFPMERTMRMAKDAGFTRLDISFYDWALPPSPFLGDQWERWIHGVAEEAQKLGMVFAQCHAYTFDFLNPAYDAETWAHHQLLVERSLACSHIVGATVCATHPDTDRTRVDTLAASKEKNREYFQPLIAYAQRLKIRLAFENMCDYAIAPLRKYGATAEELVDLVDSLGRKETGVCWDFEHADIMRQDQRGALLLLGSRLIATHVSDTHSLTDDTLMHVLPLFGTVDWVQAVRTLREIHYGGEFCFEAHNYANRLPDQVLPTALKLAYEIGRYLCDLQ